MKFASRKRITLAVLSVLGVLLTALPVCGSPRLDPIAPKIGKETTYLEKPVRADGTIDYLQALNRRASKGVTSENNAFVGIARTMPDEHWASAKHRKFVFSELGVDRPGDDQPRFWGFEHFAKDRGVDLSEPPTPRRRRRTGYEAANAPKQAVTRPDDLLDTPWRSEDHRLIAEWLKQSAPALDLARRSAKKDHWYAPLWSNETPEVLTAKLPWLGQCRALAKALVVQGQRHVANGRLDKAWRNVMAVHRLSLHVSRNGSVVDRIAGISLQSMAGNLIESIAGSSDFRPGQARKYLTELKKLDDPRPMRRVLDSNERIQLLDATTSLWRQAQAPAKKNEHWLGGKAGLPAGAAASFNPNVALRKFNDLIDRAVKVGRIDRYPAYHKRAQTAGKKIDAEIEADAENLNKNAIKAVPAGKKRKLITHAITNLLMGIMAPSFESFYRTEWTSRMSAELDTVALALGGYRARHGEYPKTLNALSPPWLDDVPDDLFIEKPLHYQRHGPQSVTVYSVGPNMKDDRGKGRANNGDDVVVRLGDASGSKEQ